MRFHRHVQDTLQAVPAAEKETAANTWAPEAYMHGEVRIRGLPEAQLSALKAQFRWR